MPVRHGLGKGIERLVGQMNQQTFEPAVEPRIGQRRGGGNLRGPQRGGQGTRQGAKRGRYHTEPPSQESVRAFHRRARACHQTRGRSELWGILTAVADEDRSKVTAVAFTPDGKHLASGARNGKITLWEVVTGKEQFSITGHDHEVGGLQFTPDGKTLISSGYYD